MSHNGKQADTQEGYAQGREEAAMRAECVSVCMCETVEEQSY